LYIHGHTLTFDHKEKKRFEIVKAVWQFDKKDCCLFLKTKQQLYILSTPFALVNKPAPDSRPYPYSVIDFYSHDKQRSLYELACRLYLKLAAQSEIAL
jgi:hypothetical protein